MRKLIILVILLTINLFAADIKIPVHGFLTDNEGVAINNNSQNVTFELYNVASGGTKIWDENQTIPVNNGVFSVKLGSVTAISSTVLENGG